MIGVDTNVLVRYIVADDEDQTRRAGRFSGRGHFCNDPGFVSVVVLVELVWVLERTYRFSPDDEIIGAIESVLRAEPLRIDRRAEVVEALGVFQTKQGSFADALIETLAERAGCAHVVTFDRKAARLPGFRLL
jgi:predicted nucleic-acid-binding protein